jgi:hypothetical protein
MLRLKISVYNIKGALSGILKRYLDYNFYILFCIIRLNYLTLPFLRRCLKYLFVSFTPPVTKLEL